MDLNIIKKVIKNTNETVGEANIINNEIAIIGMNAQIGQARNYEEFWKYIEGGLDLIRKFPEERKEDANRLNILQYNKELGENLAECAYLDKVDQFDAGFFQISATEAELMDPIQRLFLQSAWHTFEDSGYSKSQLDGSRTGVFIGYNGMGSEYSKVVQTCEPEKFPIAMSGNVSSIVAGRISYLLNLKGPAINIDTACSSSLVATHIACQQLRSGEIKMALVGGIRLMLTASQHTEQKMGIESSTERSKTFDRCADGTGGGEGVISMLLKPLKQAVNDRDHIYAVIKGSSINQDGASVGITAPNASAQEDVICQAWRDAGINPETISYIEAHGTATKLGDPIEINGIERAFSHYTGRKQFCAIGSVKSNIGHLDSAAGLAGLLKGVLMMKYKKIPPTIHFTSPNPSIRFTDSPVYVNDKLREWETEKGPRRCGISSFGISGTNCHLVLEEAPQTDLDNRNGKSPSPFYVLTSSAREKETVIKRIQSYQNYINANKEIDLTDFCYTANAGRNHYNCRLGILFQHREDFLKMNFDDLKNGEACCFYYEHKLIDSNTEHLQGYLSPEEKRKLSKQTEVLLSKRLLDIQGHSYEQLEKLLELYVKGADVNWMELYKETSCRRISIPVSPFRNKRYWFHSSRLECCNVEENQISLHPLVDKCVLDTFHMQVFEKKISTESSWELKYHKINGVNVLPGTAFIEMIHFAAAHYLNSTRFEMQGLIYMVPLVCQTGEERTLHIIVREEDTVIIIACYSISKDEKEWICHVEAKVTRGCIQKQYALDIEEVKKCCSKEETLAKLNRLSIVEINGEQWNNLRGIYANEDEILLDLKIDSRMNKEKGKYFLYPSLLDPSINGGNFILHDVHLPYSFKKARFFEELPDEMYSYISKRADEYNNAEFAVFDIVLCTKEGKVVGELDEYIIKKVHNPQQFMMNQKLQKKMFHELDWVEYERSGKEKKKAQAGEIVVVLYKQDSNVEVMLEQIRKDNITVVEAVIASTSEQLSQYKYMVENNEDGFEFLLNNVNSANIGQIILLEQDGIFKALTEAELRNKTNATLKSAFLLVKVLVNRQLRRNIDLIFLTRNASAVTGEESEINPLNEALIGLGKCIQQEYLNIKTRVIDFDYNTDSSVISDEIQHKESMFQVAYRNGKRYVPKMAEIKYLKEERDFDLIKENGTYIISGGLGGMGLAFCNYLCEVKQSVHIILLNRTFSQEEFDRGITSKDPKIHNKAQIIEKLWSEGKSIEIIKVDVADFDRMKEVIKEIKQKYRTIDGIIHTAGVKGEGFLFKKDWSNFEAVLSPKIYGTWVLNQLTLSEDLDFFVMCSSYASVFGAPGQSDYSAANAFLDSFAFFRRSLGKNGMTLNWTGWNDSGMAADSNVKEEGQYLQFVNDTEGVRAFAHCLGINKTRVLIGILNNVVISEEGQKYSSKIMLPHKVLNKEILKESDRHEKINISDIVITGKSKDKITETEKNIIYVWAKTLGIQEVDVHDKFFESGGNSLLASFLHKEVNKFYPGIVAITDIFVYSTVEGMAAFIDKKIHTTEKEDTQIQEEEYDIEKLVAQFVNGEIDRDKLEELLDD